MRPSQALRQHRDAIRRIVESHRAGNARVFGSVLSREDAEGSDLDLLVDPAPGMSLFDIGAIQAEVSELLGIPVDVVTPRALPDRWRERVLSAAEPV
jgi:predicted nucleotidyltransferase